MSSRRDKVDTKTTETSRRISGFKTSQRRSYVNEVTKKELDQVEKYADKVLAPVDIGFTNHFLDRVVDPRNIKKISMAELISFFKRLAKHKDQFITFLRQYTQFVIKDRRFMLNIPFVRMANRLVAKTIMRKADFKTPDASFKFEGVDNSELTFFLSELKKGKWQDINPMDRAEELIDLVQTAYRKAPEGSFVNTKSDLQGSEWHSIDYNKDPLVDATIFYRKARSNESWKGLKIQGIGHNGERPSIDLVLKRLKTLLNKSGIWVEASDAMEHVLYKMGAPYVSDEEYAQRMFPDTDLKMAGDRGKYTRKVGSKVIKETIFGKPKLK